MSPFEEAFEGTLTVDTRVVFDAGLGSATLYERQERSGALVLEPVEEQLAPLARAVLGIARLRDVQEERRPGGVQRLCFTVVSESAVKREATVIEIPLFRWLEQAAAPLLEVLGREGPATIATTRLAATVRLSVPDGFELGPLDDVFESCDGFAWEQQVSWSAGEVAITRQITLSSRQLSAAQLRNVQAVLADWESLPRAARLIRRR
ncbi:MAG: hypothetical protein IPJ65_06310 [Archangiaceae bacterium]|nr:hypothetical protein [Archangiaceae bacterium]